ncbi:MAG: S8 family serine peptidase [Synergistaceae bacterium]|nr:S8 family serine peptidase [Synergistaceae bacterium]
MKLSGKIILCLFMLSVPFSAYAADYVPGDVIVVLKPSSSESKLTASSFGSMGRESLRAANFAESSGASVKKIYSAVSQAGNNIYALMHSETKSPEELTAELLQNPDVLAASPNYKIHAALIPNDSYMNLCWGQDFIDAPSAWNITTGSDTVYVAVIDSGIDDTNPDLTGNIAAAYGTNTVGGESARDDYGHGSHVAGIIGAVANNNLGIAGISWNVRLISVKALDKSGEGSFSQVIAGIDYVIDLIKQGVNIKAVNMSVETYLPTTPTHDNLVQMPLWRAFKALDELNEAVIVVAAGNHSVEVGQPTTKRKVTNGVLVFDKGYYVYPPSFLGLDNMISVSALNTDGTIAEFSNTGADISAPGVEIASMWLQNTKTYIQADGVSMRTLQGTSMAAPFVSGAAALLASEYPESTAYQLKRAILDGSGSRLNLLDALAYQAESVAIPDTSTENTDYSDYNDYEPSENVYDDPDTTSRSSSGSSGCNGTAGNIFAAVMILALVIKIKGCHLPKNS